MKRYNVIYTNNKIVINKVKKKHNFQQKLHRQQCHVLSRCLSRSVIHLLMPETKSTARSFGLKCVVS